MKKYLPPYPAFFREPQRLGKYTWSEALIFLGPTILLGFLLEPFFSAGSWVVSSGIGYISYKVLQVITQGSFGDMAGAIKYWMLPSEKFFSHLPPSNVREWY